MKSRITFILLILVVFASCSKDKKDPQQNQLNLLISKPWKPAYTDNTSTLNPTGPNAYYAFQPCEKGETLKFAADSTVTFKPGLSPCAPYGSSTQVLDYSLDVAGKRIIINGVNYSLILLSATQLKYYLSISPGTGYNNLIFVFEH